LKRILISNVTCYAPLNDMPSIISGIPGHAVEDVKISDCYFLQKGGGTLEMAALQPVEKPDAYPEPARFGPLPAQHVYLRHVSNIEFSHVELASASPDARPAIWLDDVRGADFSHLKPPLAAQAFLLNSGVTDFRISESRGLRNVAIDSAPSRMQI
jgi:hypothetical protein